MTIKPLLLFLCCLLSLLLPTRTVFACDLCALHGATDVDEVSKGFLRLGVSEQFTRFTDLQLDGKNRSNPRSQNLNSHIVQIYGDYGLSDKLALQINIPLIYRTFRRPLDDGRIEKGKERGIGDISLLARYAAIKHSDNDFFLNWQIFSGVKIPSGDASRLREETSEDHHEDHSHTSTHSHSSLFSSTSSLSTSRPEFFSAIHGHDLALGTGSSDFIFGSTLSVQKSRYFAKAAAQYTLRTEGDFDYENADDLQWHFKLGTYLYLKHERHLAISARLSGEFKDKDRLAGTPVNDTRITTLNLGPEIALALGEHWSVNVLFELPIEQEASSLQIVPSYRIIAGLSYKFKVSS